MSDTIRHEIGRWTITTLLREPCSLRRGEIKTWASTGGEVVKRDGGHVVETPYISHDLLSAYWTRAEWATDALVVDLKVSNGEMAGVSLTVALPKLMRVYAKVGAPRRLIKPWVMDGRSFGITLGGVAVAELRIAHEDDSGGMRSYYQAKIDRGVPRPDYIGRWALIQGLRIGWSRYKWANVLLGKSAVDVDELDTGDAIVPMPEGNYRATWKRERRTWRRERIPWPLRTEDSVWLDITGGIPVPGKGENSWDIDDDAVMGTGGRTVHDAIANAVSSATRQRNQYAGPGWTPDAGWAEEIAR